MLTALSPLDGRYGSKAAPLAVHFSEEALMRARITVEIRYFIALGNEPKITELPTLSKAQVRALEKIIADFDTAEAKKVKKIEQTTNHDVKAIEYYLKQKVEKIPGLKRHVEFIHFCLTSEDVNNLAYGLMVSAALQDVIIPSVRSTISDFQKLAKKWANFQMLSLTHGQPATPTTVGREFQVFVERLEWQFAHLKTFKMHGKFGGAVGNYAAHSIVYPHVKWDAFGRKFIKSLKLLPLEHTTQINPHDDIAELSHLLHRVDTILIDASRDMWSYISRGIFGQKVVKGEVGSSTMPHKVNPIDFENAEGNFGLANALFSHFADKLPISRMQRDLSDSTVQRNIGSALGYHHIGILALRKGLGKLSLNRAVLRQELHDHPEVLAEPIQIILRKKGVAGAYEKLKALTRGEKITVVDMVEFMDDAEFTEEEMGQVLALLG